MVAPHSLHQQESRVTEAPAAASDIVLQAAKAAARTAARVKRAGLANATAPVRLAEDLLAGFAPPPGAIIAGYWPMGEEMDPRPLMLALAARGHALALPVTPPCGQPLTFRAWAPGAALPGAKAIGIAYAGQEMAEVPAGPQDFRLPLIATEAGVIVCGDPV